VPATDESGVSDTDAVAEAEGEADTDALKDAVTDEEGDIEPVTDALMLTLGDSLADDELDGVAPSESVALGDAVFVDEYDVLTDWVAVLEKDLLLDAESDGCRVPVADSDLDREGVLLAVPLLVAVSEKLLLSEAVAESVAVEVTVTLWLSVELMDGETVPVCVPVLETELVSVCVFVLVRVPLPDSLAVMDTVAVSDPV
jgi:hypothetical protein